MKIGGDPRHKARRIALGTIFEWSFYSHNSDESFDHVQSEYAPTGDFDQTLARSIVRGVIAEVDLIDKIITSAAPQWPVEQINKIDLTSLRIAVYELYFAKKIPPKVAIDESIELAKEFGSETSGKFVNGVLGTIVKMLVPEGDI